mmetsp:Transcript_15493/g.33524  ORF Transcript_15493/g.33524 Transcript_15493/m.33524 type:complete len:652 (-) Transcript_15493:268-2223(-)
MDSSELGAQLVRVTAERDALLAQTQQLQAQAQLEASAAVLQQQPPVAPGGVASDVQPSVDVPVTPLLQNPLAQLLWGVGRGWAGPGQATGATPPQTVQGTQVPHRLSASLVNTAERDALLAQLMVLAGGQQQSSTPTQTPAAAIPGGTQAVVHYTQSLPPPAPPTLPPLAPARPTSATPLAHDSSTIVPYHSGHLTHVNPQQLLAAHPQHQLLPHPQQGNVQILVLEWPGGGATMVPGGGASPVVGTGAGLVDEGKPVVTRRCTQLGCPHLVPPSGGPLCDLHAVCAVRKQCELVGCQDMAVGSDRFCAAHMEAAHLPFTLCGHPGCGNKASTGDLFCLLHVDDHVDGGSTSGGHMRACPPPPPPKGPSPSCAAEVAQAKRTSFVRRRLCCQHASCSKSARSGTQFCVSHGGGTRCQIEGCIRSAVGRTRHCIAHGGGKRCQVAGCPKSAAGATAMCIAHGGGRRCSYEGCSKSAQGTLDRCTAHGAGRRCTHEGCNTAARGNTFKCKAHGGGKRCVFESCTKSAVERSNTPYCRTHGVDQRGAVKASNTSAADQSQHCASHTVHVTLMQMGAEAEATTTSSPSTTASPTTSTVGKGESSRDPTTKVTASSMAEPTSLDNGGGTNPAEHGVVEVTTTVVDGVVVLPEEVPQ